MEKIIREVNLKELVKMIETNVVAIATCNNGEPNAAPVAYVKVKDGQIIITDNYLGKILDNIKTNSQVCLVVWNKEMKGYKIFGKAEYYDSGEWVEFVKSLPENKGEPCKGAIVVTPLDTRDIGI